MRKRKTLFMAGLSLLLTVCLVALVIFMVKHEPGFYRRAEVLPGKDRKDLSKAYFGLFTRLLNHWKDWTGEWDVTFTERQINSYFEEDYKRLGDDEVLRKQRITDPRIVLENGVLRLAFRYGTPPWSTIISYDLKLWLAPKEENVVCLEIVGRHAGALPISSQSLLNDISEVAGRNGFQVTWYRHEGNPVGLIRFPADQSRPSAQLRRLEVNQGSITIGGFSQNQSARGMFGPLAPMGN